MLVIGIDPGTAITGYGLVREQSDGTLRLVDYGVIQTRATLTPPQRLLELHQRLREILLLHQPDCAAVEKLFFQRNVRTAFGVGQARGAHVGAGCTKKTTREGKPGVVGYGGADKNQVQHMVRALLNLEEIPSPDDAADALAVAICHIHSAKIKALAYQAD